MVTVFTPTYNREKLLPRLYESLCSQTDQDFEWLIVDDGSEDNTIDLIQNWINNDCINVRLLKQSNAGKHMAINNGVINARGEFFFIVDSDDYLFPEAIEIINIQFESIKNMKDKKFAGISALCVTRDGRVIGEEPPYETLDTDVISFRYKYNIKGDKAEVFYTEVLRNYPFPKIEGEKFCPEALVWNRIGAKYILRNVNNRLYVRDYQLGGLTNKIVSIRKQSPLATTIYYSELAQNRNVPLNIIFKSTINFWRFSCYHKDNISKKAFFLRKPFLSIFCYPLSLLLRLKDARL